VERLLLVACPTLTGPTMTGPDPTGPDPTGPDPTGPDPTGPDPTGPDPTGGEAGGDGHRLRELAVVVEALADLCPWVDAVRPGVCALPIKGPARYFGGEEAVLERVARAVAEALAPRPPAAPSPDLQLGVAEGVFAAALAARSAVVVPPGGTPAFLAPWPVATLATPELCELLPRLGLHTLGEFAALAAPDVTARFGAAGARCHRIARGVEGELPGYRVPGLAARLASFQHGIELRNHQPGFWGELGTAGLRAAQVLTTLQRRLGPEAVVRVELAGGRGPGDRARFVTWRPDRSPPPPGTTPTAGTAPPWPGQLPPPAPARVAAPGVPGRVGQTGGGYAARVSELETT